VQDVTDPMGLVNRTYYDNLGRVTQTIQDYTNGTETAESNISTEYAYDGNDNVTSVQADQPGGTHQKTAYVYGVTTGTGGSGVNSNDILSAIQHPDPANGNPSATQQDTYLVNALGQVIQTTDRNGNIHQLTYDVLGRLTADAVTTPGTGVDTSVRRIEYKYDSQGNNYLITSYDAASAGNIVNQVQRSFNGLGQLTNEYQSHSGAVNTSSTPQVQYAYTEMSGGQNNSRLTSMTYPSGYVLNFNYSAGLNSNISRLSSISDASNTLESYQYLGLATVAERDHPQTNVNQTVIKQTGDTQALTDGGDQYEGLDRFGRVIDQNWVNGSTGVSTDRFQYGYNADSDVLYRQNLVDAAMSELYSYDNLHQLTLFQRGTLNAQHNGIVGNPSHSQSWTPDALGNFTSITTDSSTQTRSANQQNEYTSISGSGTITYDANGNITADGSGNTFVYDAWNRLVAVKNGSTTLASYGYDGLGRRITETHSTTTTDLYYSADWQVLEERQGGVVQTRYVWSPAGVDMLVLRDYSTQHNGVLDQRLYVQQDIIGNVTALVDTSGNVVERYDYDPYGAVTVLNTDFSVRGSSSYSWNYFFQGKRYDGTVGLYDSRGRVYSPTLVRPLQADPLGLGPDNNDYRWAGDSPTVAVDPSGLQPRPLGIMERVILAVFHRSVNDISEEEFSYILEKTRIVVDKSLFAESKKLAGPRFRIASTRDRIITIALSGGADAITLPPVLDPDKRLLITLNSTRSQCAGNLLPLTSDELWGLKAHELQHAVQIARVKENDGQAFLTRYLNDYIANVQDLGTRGDKAYRFIPAEIEAYAFDRAFRKILRTRTGRDALTRIVSRYKDKDAYSLIEKDADAKELAETFKEEYEFELRKGKREAERNGAHPRW
jgi:RHS repeat-associated protein